MRTTIAPTAALLLAIGFLPPVSAAQTTWGRPAAVEADQTSRPATEPQAPEPRVSGGWRWPLAGTPRLVRGFDPPPRPWLPGHRGVDLAASPGWPVLAAGGGTVVYAGVLAGRGVVSVDHPGGLRTTYEPVDALVEAGDVVAAGSTIGLLAAGHPGCSASACLHWGLRRGSLYLDPLAVLGLARVRLLPGGGALRLTIFASPVSRVAGPAGPRRAARSRRRCCRSGR
ncbi:murein hydrolase activator EnvC family protein [Catellatospora aurea]|uniref:Murein hydrolase activator EnvC family protein n=1 Tax=Catellatospora aurea TaxID=1337874 RepID=A0ABW2GVX2_9ACTN